MSATLLQHDDAQQQQQQQQQQQSVSEDREQAIRSIWNKNCEGLDVQEQAEMWQVLWEFKDLFALNDNEVGLTHLVEHHIDTGDARPIKVRPRRLPMIRQEAADNEVQAMLEAGIIEPSDSPWSSAVVMVPRKKSLRWRFCVDYRPLNKVTRKDCYPLPRVDETLDLVSGSSWFSSLDLRSGYWQVPLSPESRPKTAFSTGRGHWQFKVLSFGLCNAPGTFERLMDRILANVPRQECLVYLDDVLVHGNSFHAALDSLRLVLGRIAAAGLKLHPDKCHFMQREVEFLGHKVNGEGISTLQEKIQVIKDWPVPGNQKQLKSFLGLASYYRRFVRGFSCIGAPLFRLLQKNQAFTWTTDCQEAFVTLKQALINAPVLTPPDPSLPFMLDTDASNVGAGAVLSQISPEGERVVAYFSRVFNKSERRYCVTRRELLAVVLAARHFKYYLCGVPFTIRTDHAALRWLMSFREPEAQVARWLEELQSFHFEVVHRSGAQHANADALSRRPCAATGCSYCDRRDAREAELRGEVPVAVPTCCSVEIVGAADWASEQEKDKDLNPVRRWVISGVRPSWEDVMGFSVATKGLWSKFSTLRVIDGVLQRAWKEPATGEARWQVVVPKTLREAVLGVCHGGAGSGHFGTTKTLRRLRQEYYWGQHRRDVEDFCRRCDACAAYKGPLDQSHAPLQQQAVGAPMERVAVDIMGPFPVSDRGNKYVMCAMDYFTKWPEAYALPDQEAETVADALLEGMFSRFGTPDTIHSDQGRNFESRVFAALCDRLKLQKTRTTPLHPQSDGLVERFNRTMQQQLAILTAAHQRDWDKHIPLALMAYRSAVQNSTNCTPALLMLGREIRTPAALAYGQPPGTSEDVPGTEYARKLQDRLESAHAFARDQLDKAGMRQKRNYDVRNKGTDFLVGDLVWVYTPKRKKGRCPKLDSHWDGPCRVLERVGEVVYRVQVPPRGRKIVLHRDRLAPYRGSAAPVFERRVSPQSSPAHVAHHDPSVPFPVTPSQPLVTSETGSRPHRPRRLRNRPPRFADFVMSP